MGIRVLREANSTRPLVWSYEHNQREYVVKDYSFHRGWYRGVGRFLIYREVKALKRLSPMEGVPNLVLWFSPYRLVTERISGITLEEAERGRKIDLNFFEDLKALIARLHQRGVAHCDLKRAANILVTEEGKPTILDFSSAIFQEEFPFLLKAIYARFQRDDLAAVVKFKGRLFPEEVSELERATFLKRGKLESLVRRVRDRIRDLIKVMARG